MAQILVVEDDTSLARALADRLTFWGHSTHTSANGQSALELARKREFDLVLLDLALPGLSGLEVLERLRTAGSTSEIVILTAHGSVEAAVQAIKLGATDFLQKPADFDLVKTVVDRALRSRQLVRERSAALVRLESGRPASMDPVSASMRTLLDTARRVARSNVVVLIHGESGCGKQVLAEWIHKESARAEGPFVYVNCVALSDDLVESTLFGHERGAFTGATARKDGRLETAAHGTAFLDEIGEISPKVQVKLLHFLETNEFERVGGTQTLHVDCRIVAATNRDLAAEVRAGRFREDLYFRLNVIQLLVPPLRERREDIAPLAHAFLQRYERELRRAPLHFDERTLGLLNRYSWPGNVRQLRNVIERMAVLATEETLTPDLLPPEILDTEDALAAGASAGAPTGTVDISSALESGRSLHEAERAFRARYIAAALSRMHGNQTRAAEILGLQRTFLNRLIKQLGL